MMWLPDQTLLQTPVLFDITFIGLHHRHRALLGPYLRCTFATQHQYLCDTISIIETSLQFSTNETENDRHHFIDDDDGKILSNNKPEHNQQPKVTNKRTITNRKMLKTETEKSEHNNNNNHYLWWLSLFMINLWTICGNILQSTLKIYHWIKWISIHPYLLLTYLTFIAYWPSLSGELVFDDRPAIIDNNDLRSHTSWTQLWFNDYWGTPLKSPLSHKSYRPLTVATFRLNHLIHGLEPFGYHLVNLILHSIVSIIFYRLCCLFFPESSSSSSTIVNIDHHQQQQQKQTKWKLTSTSFLISLLFVVHPIHTDCVASVVGRAEMLSAIFYLSAILLWCERTRINRTGSSIVRNHHPQLLRERQYKMLATIFALIGFMCKEQSIMVIIYLCLLELNRINNDHRMINSKQTMGQHDQRSTTIMIRRQLQRRRSSINISENVITIGLLLATLLTAIVIRLAIMDYTLPIFNRFDNPASRATFPIKQLTFAYVGVYHFWLLLLPLRLNCDWSHSSIELINVEHNSISEWCLAIIPMMIIMSIALFMLRLAYNVLVVDAKYHMASFRWCHIDCSSLSRSSSHFRWKQLTLHGFALTFIPFIPASNLFFPAGFVIAERILYLPSVGILLLIGIGIDYIVKRWKKFTIFVRFALTTLLIVFTIKTNLRSSEWSNEHRLFRSGLDVSPRNTKLLNNLGRLYEKEMNVAYAIELYEEAIRIEPSDIRSHLNLGNALLSMNDSIGAERAYQQALKYSESELFEPSSSKTKNLPTIVHNPTISPLYHTVLVRLAELFHNDASRVRDLEQIKTKMITFNSLITNSLELSHLYNMAIVHYRQGKTIQALNYFEQVLTYDPNHEKSLLASARIIQDEDLNQYVEVAINRLTKLIQLGKGDSTVLFNLAMFAVKVGNNVEARKLFERAIDQRPTFSEAHYNLALLLVKGLDSRMIVEVENERMSNVHLAIWHLKKVLTINPKHVKSMLVLGDLYADEIGSVRISRKYYQMVIDLNDSNTLLRARHNLCVLWHKQNDLNRAIECFQYLKRDLIYSGHGHNNNIDDNNNNDERGTQSINTVDRIEMQIQILLKTKREIQRSNTMFNGTQNNCYNHHNYTNIDKIKHDRSKHLMASKLVTMCVT